MHIFMKIILFLLLMMSCQKKHLEIKDAFDDYMQAVYSQDYEKIYNYLPLDLRVVSSEEFIEVQKKQENFLLKDLISKSKYQIIKINYLDEYIEVYVNERVPDFKWIVEKISRENVTKNEEVTKVLSNTPFIVKEKIYRIYKEKDHWFIF